MSTKVNVIITENFIYATYVKTICFKKSYLGEDEKSQVIREAYSVAFSYAIGFSSVLCSQVNKSSIKNDDDVFEYLDKIN